MKLFHSFTIAHRLLLVFIVLIGGFITLSVAYRQVLDIDSQLAEVTEKAEAFENLIDKILVGVGTLSGEAYAFLLSKDIRYAEDFFDDDSFDAMDDNISELGILINEPEMLPLVQQAKEALTAYGEAFDKLANARVMLGLSENSGLEGDMRITGRSLEEKLEALSQTQLLVMLLQMRRQEKNFIITEDTEYVRLFHDQLSNFGVLLDQADIAPVQINALKHEVAFYSRAFDAFVAATHRYQARNDDLDTAQQTLKRLVDALNEQRIIVVRNSIASADVIKQQDTLFMTGVIIAVGGSVTILLLLLAVTLRKSLSTLQNTVQLVAAGDLTARSNLTGNNELGVLGRAFDNLLNERVTTMARAEKENEALNSSIISIIETVARMSQKDLTIKAIVAEDITGTVSDALNLMVAETGEVLLEIRRVAAAVGQAANAVYEQAEKVNDVASQERRLVQKSAEGLHSAGQALGQLVQGAQSANIKADAAMAKTRQALVAVSTNIQGIDRIRDIIRETEKRIKRLGERSQEITGVVNLINAISERTHILALNASMHAASAGEAGRGFAVVADEVQRLAESSQKATSDIAVMVNAIRQETSDTLETMNRLIVQVAEGTRQAQEAGQRMRETEATTADLVQAVQGMAEGAEQQANSALELRKQSQSIVRSTEQTSSELQEQSTYTMRLVEYAKTLRDAVAVFRLPTNE